MGADGDSRENVRLFVAHSCLNDGVIASVVHAQPDHGRENVSEHEKDVSSPGKAHEAVRFVGFADSAQGRVFTK